MPVGGAPDGLSRSAAPLQDCMFGSVGFNEKAGTLTGSGRTALAVGLFALLAAVATTATVTTTAVTAWGADAALAGGRGGGAPAMEPDPLFDDDWDIEEPLGYPDPFEPANRFFLAFNRGIDKALFDPLTKGYRFVLPQQLRLIVRRVFLNLGSPPIIVNDVLQGEFDAAWLAFGRLTINTLLGGGGIADIAAGVGMPRHRADFGQTLALYGAPSGPYLVLPIFGPGSVRDFVGGTVDGLMRPATWILGFSQQIYYGGGSGLSTREENYDALQALVDSSVDFYAALRNAYYQSRTGEIWQRRDEPIVVLLPEVTDRRYSSEARGRRCHWLMRRGPRTGLKSCSRDSRAPH